MDLIDEDNEEINIAKQSGPSNEVEQNGGSSQEANGCQQQARQPSNRAIETLNVIGDKIDDMTRGHPRQIRQ